MKKVAKLLIIFAALLANCGLYAQTVDRQTAATAAQTFISMRYPQLADAAIKEISSQLGLQNLYTYSIGEEGFVIVSNDYRAMPILGYSFGNQTLAETNLPPALIDWMKMYDNEISLAKSIDDNASEICLSAWNNLLGGNHNTPKAVADSVQPLINSTWRQYGGYNRYCPVDSTLESLGYHTTTGCVATAMAQIMRYWGWPSHGMGNMTYTHEGEYPCWRYGSVSADFANTNYDWEYMPSALTDSSSEREIDAVATLCSHCGVSVYMMYNSDCNGSSGSYTAYAATAFTNTFHYKQTQALNRNYYSATQWVNKLKEELSANRPVMYSGTSIEDTTREVYGGGHAFLTDGYNSDSYFHFNWGWGGYYDGYYLVSALDPSGHYEFNYGQTAIFGIEPELNPLAVPVLAQEITLDREDFQMGGNVSGTYAVTNIGDTTYNGYIGVNIYNPYNYDFYGWIDATEVHIAPGDTIFRAFDNPGIERPVGTYYALGQYNATPLYITDSVDNALNCFPNSTAWFKSVDTNRSQLRNIVVTVSFAGEEDPEISKNTLSSMLNSTNSNTFSAYNYINATTQGKHRVQSLLPSGTNDSKVINYQDDNTREFYQPYGSDNPNGYTCGSSYNNRINYLLMNIAHLIDSMSAIDYNTIIDADGDGYVDNLTILTKSGSPIMGSNKKALCSTYVGDININYRRIGQYAILSEDDAVENHCYSLLRMIGLPDMSHRNVYTEVSPLGQWDIMDIPHKQQPSYILKYKYLNIGNEPEAITASGWYELPTDPTDNGTHCYSITVPSNEKVSFMLEYRNSDYFFDQGVPTSGLTVGRWNSDGLNIDFDNGSTANQYWIERPGSTSDTIEGDIANAAVSTPRTISYADSDVFTIDSMVWLDLGSLRFHITLANDDNNSESINDLYTTDNIKIFPNPTNRFITIEGEGIENIEIFNITGSRIISTNQNTIDLQQLCNGVYVVKVTTADGIAQKKIVKR